MTKILIVDDNAQNLYMLEVLLTTNGFIVDQAANGVEALTLAKENKPDMIITDILMPTMDGFSLCRAVKKDEKLKNIPIIFYTATYTDMKDEEFALSLGADRFVIKPQAPDIFLGIINEVFEQKKTIKPQKILEETTDRENDYYKGYNEALIRKLEKKMLQLEKSNKRLNSFFQVTSDLITNRSSSELLRRVLNAIHEITGYQKLFFFDVSKGLDNITIGEALGVQEYMLENVKELLRNPPPDTHNFVKTVAVNRTPEYVPDTSKDKRWIRTDQTIRSALFVPVYYEDQTLGIIGLFSSDTDVFADDEKNIITLANNLAISMINKQTENKIIQMNLDLEDRILERTNQLQASNRDLEAFAFSVSHDLRAPLRAIEGYSALLMEDNRNKLDDESVRILELVCQNTQRMDKFITDLLSLSKMSLTDKKFLQVNMDEIVNDVIAEITKDKKTAKYSFILSSLPEVFADPVLIRQVWMNLILNAVKYSEYKEEPVIKISCENKEEENVFLVEDNGIGFNQSIAQNLFQPFQRLYQGDEFEGTGIGLTIVKRIVERHGGRVWAIGKQNEGAKFYFTIPKLDASHKSE